MNENENNTGFETDESDNTMTPPVQDIPDTEPEPSYNEAPDDQTTGDGITDNETPDDQTAGDGITDNEATDDIAADDETLDNETTNSSISDGEAKKASKKTAYTLITVILALLTVAIVLIVVFIKKNNESEPDEGFHQATATLVPAQDNADKDNTSGDSTSGDDVSATATPAEGNEDVVEPDIQVTLGQYKEIEVTRTVAEVSEEEVEAQFNNLTTKYTKNEAVTDRTEVQDGDVLNIDFVGTIDGVAFEGGTAQGYELIIGSNSFIDGFEDGLIGKKVGETVSLDLFFPDPYTRNPELAGDPVNFSVTINSISVPSVPEITDAFIKENEGFDSIEAYKENLRQNISAKNETAADQKVSEDVLLIAVNNATYEGDLNVAYSAKANEVSTYYENVAMYYYGTDAKTLFAGLYGYDESAYNSFIANTAEYAVKQIAMLEAVAEAEGMTVSEEEYAEELPAFLENYGVASEEELYANVSKEDVISDMLKQKALDFIVEAAVIK